MSDMKKLDDYFKGSFGNYSPEVPPHIWENIVSGRKKRKPVIFWFNKKNGLIAAAILMVLTSAGLLFKKQENKIIAHENNESSKGNGIGILVPPATVFKDNTITTTKENDLKAVTGNDKTVLPTHDKENQNKISSTTSNATVDAERDVSIYIHPQNNNDGGTAVKNTLTNNRKIFLYKKSRGKFTANLNTAEEITVNETVAGKDKNMKVPTQQNLLLNHILYGAEKITAASLIDAGSRNTVLKSLPSPGCPELEKNAAGNKYYLEAYAGPDYAFKKYNDTANSTLLERRKESVSFQSAFSAGVRYTRVFGNGMSLRTGINFSQINEKFSFIQSNVVQLTYVINPATGDTTESYYVRGTRYKTSYNHYRTIDLPLVVGYELGNGRLHANINAGAMINIYSWQKGETLDTAYQPVSFTTGKGNPSYQYKTNVGVGFTAAVSFYYKLNEHLHLLAEPYYRYNFSPINKQAFSIQEKFTTVGLRLGVRLDLQ